MTTAVGEATVLQISNQGLCNYFSRVWSTQCAVCGRYYEKLMSSENFRCWTVICLLKASKKKKKKKGSRPWIKALLNRVAWHFIEGIEGRQEDFLYCFLNLKLSLGSKVSYSSCRFKSNKNLNSPFWKTKFNFLI